jgi:hypothetical protein
MTLSAALMLMVGCSNDEVGENLRQSAPIEVAAYVSTYTDVEPIGPVSTRAVADWMPSGYMPYTDLTGVGGVLRSNENASIGVFFTNESGILPRKFIHSGEKWRIDPEIENSGDYYLYGYVPYSAATPYNELSPATSTNIVPNDTYANGAILTLSGLNSVMTQDVCVIVGAKHGTKADESAPVLPATGAKVAVGDFMCQIHSGSETSPNYVFLLFDHLYAALRFRFRVDAKYAELRTIKLKKLELLAFQDEACLNRMSKKVQTTVTLRKTDGTSPIVSVGNFTTDNTTPGGSAPMDWAVICNNESDPVILPSGSEYTDNMGFVPKTSSFYQLRSTYDVYDKENNLVRQDCVAENKIDPRKLFLKEQLDRGHIYTLRFTVNPTYLYVLSEPDLDNPTMFLE